MIDAPRPLLLGPELTAAQVAVCASLVPGDVVTMAHAPIQASLGIDFFFAQVTGEALSRAVLENCVGGPLSPGIETTWIARNPAIYAEAYRLRAKSPAPSPLSLGFDPADGLEPGDLTRYMALPWQADFNECATQRIQGRVLWWWPAQRPIAVFLPDEVTGKPGSQVPWIGSNEDPAARGFYCFADHLEMLRSWDKLGFVLDVGQPGTPQFVEVGRKLSRTPVKAK